MSKKKRSFFNTNKGLMLISGIIVICLSLIASASYIVGKDNDSRISQSPDLPTKELRGKVTRINLNGRDFIIDENGDKAPGPGYGIADTGDFITVNGQSFSTSSGNSSIEDSFYIDIKSINLGDEVIVNYAINESGNKTLSCRNCSIEKEL